MKGSMAGRAINDLKRTLDDERHDVLFLDHEANGIPEPLGEICLTHGVEDAWEALKTGIEAWAGTKKLSLGVPFVAWWH